VSAKDLKKVTAAAAMSKKEIEEFLSAPKVARIATIQNGKPHVVPVWYFYDGTNILVSTTKGAGKAKNLQTNPNVSITIDDVEGKLEDISFLNAKAVIIEGTGELKDDINNLFAKKMYERYVGKNALSNPMVQFSVNLPRYILVVKPTKIISWDFTKIPPFDQ
jgi:nitroimidazol reductase NimA-like FMN-containing flavoprotein (pyridoxamine 5'-phosphate oxidase superfamily)